MTSAVQMCRAASRLGTREEGAEELVPDAERDLDVPELYVAASLKAGLRRSPTCCLTVTRWRDYPSLGRTWIAIP